MTTNNSVNSPLSGTTGTGNFVGSNTPAVTTPKIITGMLDTNGNNIIGVNPVSSAVNYISVENNATGSRPSITGVGSDTNVILQIGGQGTGGAAIQGTATNNNAPAGFIGEFVSSVILSGSAVTATSGTATDLTSISLTAGDWLAWGNICWPTLGTTPTAIIAWISTASATLPDPALRPGLIMTTATFSTNSGITCVPVRISIAITTTVFITGFLGNVSGNGTQCGGIYARRVR